MALNPRSVPARSRARRKSRKVWGHADFDRDNKPDLVVATYSSLSVLLGNGDGTFQTHVDYSGSGPSVVAADLNDDGKMDVITGTIHSIAVRLGNGDGTFQNAISSLNLGLDELSKWSWQTSTRTGSRTPQ